MDISPEILYAGVGKTVMAVDRFSGRPVWRVKLPRLLGGHISMVLPHGNELYVGRGAYVYCLDRFTGRVLWERGMGSMGGVLLLAVPFNDNGQQQARASMRIAQQHAASAGAAAAAGS
jgi:outer membrane protein assembly factor BamB